MNVVTTYPGPLSQAVQSKLICDLSRVHRILSQITSAPELKGSPRIAATHGQILLVGKHQKKRIPQLVLVQHPLKLLPSLADTLPVVGVDDEDNTLGVLEVMAPEGADLVLSTDIPHGEGDVLVLDRLDVES